MFHWHHKRVGPEDKLVPGQLFGTRYKLIEKIGEGGMGVVWKALHIRLDQLFAIKMMRHEVVSETGLARFEEEARLAAALDHPGIVRVREFDKQDGCHYLAMDYISGQTLEASLAKGPLVPKEAAAMLRNVADAIRYAHDREIIHRDLKPANILLDDEQAGYPRVADFGLARRVNVARGVTTIGNILGTPGYMAPEQALGHTPQINKPCDIFALGAILFHTLTGCPPFLSSAESGEWLEGPRGIKGDIPETLDAICLACLAIRPDKRLTARELAVRLGAFLEGAPQQEAARPVSIPRQEHHVVICGLGDLGLRLALEGRTRGKSIVAIEQNGDPAAIRQARASGVELIEGDATEPDVLRRAGVDEAEFVVAACQDDETNVAIAAGIPAVLPPQFNRADPLVCRLLLTDEDLRVLLANQSIFPAGSSADRVRLRASYQINFGDLNLHGTAARQCLRNHNLDFGPIHAGDETVVHLVIAGFGPMGQNLALHAVRIGHFANGACGKFPLCITVFDDRKEPFESFQRRFAKIPEMCRLRFQPVEQDASLMSELDKVSVESGNDHRLVTYAICLEKDQAADDRNNFRIGFELSRLTVGRPAQTLIYQSTRRGFASLFPSEGRGGGLSPHVHVFGMRDDVYRWDVLLHESEDRVARALHEDFQQQRRQEGVLDSDNPGWGQLEEDRKESNRHAADHIPIKLRALGCHVEPIQSGKNRVEQFTKEETQILAQMEHARWCAERLLAGWSYKPEKNLESKTHPCLVPWKDLPPGEQKKDYEQIGAIPRVLGATGRGIYRQVSPLEA